MTATDDPNPKHVVPESDREGDINDDRQDAPRPTKTGGHDDELDGFRATPGDDAEDE